MEMEQLSALMDGELEVDHADRALRGLRDDPEALAAWSEFHLIGDALRGEAARPATLSPRLAAALAAEPTILAPRRSDRPTPTNLRRFALPLAASVAGVAVVAWLAISNQQAIPEAGPGPIASDEVVRDLMSVHQAFSPSAAMPGVASYIRTVGLSDRDRGR